MQVEELADDVIFLHKIAPGSAEKSFGIHVAKLAGVPKSVLDRAHAVLGTLEGPPVVVHAPELRPAVPPPTPCEPPSLPATPKPAAVPKAKPAATPVLIDPPERPRRRTRDEAGPEPVRRAGRRQRVTPG